MVNEYEFEIPKDNHFIKVIGVGGGGSNAARNMFKLGITGVDFIVCNTDIQALNDSPIAKKLPLGRNLTGGLGAGANPEVGKNAALESKKEIQEILSDGTKMLFITAGMGGGTGTGAAPVIAEIANKLNILTVGVVTLPFSFEGKKKAEQAQLGIKSLRDHCDTVIVILNDRIKDVLGNLTLGNAFAKADEVQTNAAKSIAEIITVPGYVNVDFKDVKTVMEKAGTAVMGSGLAEGEGRALKAVTQALSSPLLEYKDINGAKKILLSITFGKECELNMDELSVITDYIRTQIGEDAEMIFGYGDDKNLKEALKVTIIVTGFNEKNNSISEENSGIKIVHKTIFPDLGNENNNRSNQNIISEIKKIPFDFANKHIKSNNELKYDNDLRIFYEEMLSVPAYKRKNIILNFEIKEGSKKVIL